MTSFPLYTAVCFPHVRHWHDKCSACFLSSFLPPEHCHTPFISIPWHIAIRSVHQEQRMTVKTEIILECWNNHFLIESNYYMFVKKKEKMTIFTVLIHLYGLVVNDCERKKWWNAKLLTLSQPPFFSNLASFHIFYLFSSSVFGFILEYISLRK